MKTRTMIYLETDQHRALRKEASAKGMSLAELIRRLIARYLKDMQPAVPPPRDVMLGLLGLGASGRKHVSVRHDAYLGDAAGRGDTR